jgi:hypothetical protein
MLSYLVDAPSVRTGRPAVLCHFFERTNQVAAQRTLRDQARRGSLEIRLEEDDIVRIREYAANSKRGGWQARTLKIFGRVLGLER